VISPEYIKNIAEEQLKGTPLFVTAIKIGSDNQISIAIDGDNGVKIDDCVSLSRAIEKSLDREKEDFSLDVTSNGATTPLLMPRQYKRHVGRDLEVKLLDGGKTEGRLVAADDTGITLEQQLRENKPVGKGKITVTRQTALKYDEIREARIKLKF
jgi:ribosome maturation factor RimP